MAKPKQEDQKPPTPPTGADEKDQAQEVLVKVKMCITAQGPELRLMANQVVMLPAAQAAALIKAGAAEKFVEKAADKKAEGRETR